jgi:hypothetical protein
MSTTKPAQSLNSCRPDARAGIPGSQLPISDFTPALLLLLYILTPEQPQFAGVPPGLTAAFHAQMPIPKGRRREISSTTQSPFPCNILQPKPAFHFADDYGIGKVGYSCW